MDQPLPTKRSQGKVLILPFNFGGLRILALLANAMVKDGRLDPCLVLTTDALMEHAKTLDFAHLPRVKMLLPHIRVPWEKPPQDPKLLASLKFFCLRAFSKLIPEWAFEIWWQRKWYQRYYDNAIKLIKKTKPLAVVTIDDRMPGIIPILKAAHNLGVATLLVPHAVPAYSKSLITNRANQPDRNLKHPRQRYLKRWVAWRYPNQVLTQEMGKVLYYPPSSLIALAACDMLPDNPFSVGGGLSQKVAVGGHDKLRLVQDGIDSAKIAVTGEPGLDNLYQVFRKSETRRDQLVKDYELNPKSKIILCAVPQLGEHGRVPWERHWEIVRELINTLAASGQMVLLSLHPKTEVSNYLFLEEKPGVYIAREPLMNILPCADIFVSGFSSTVRWAVLGNVPTIIVDILNNNWDLFNNINGVIHIRGENVFSDLAEQLNNLLNDPAKLQEVRHSLAKAAPKVAPFDGRVNQRIIELIIEMTVSE